MAVDLRQLYSRGIVASQETQEMLKASLDPDDQEASQDVGKYLQGRGIDGIIFPSVLGGGANLVVFKDADPPPFVDIQNRDDVMKALEEFAQRIRGSR